MTKSLLISIQPQHLLKVLNGDKTYEVRKVVPKWVLEALERGETVEAYLYCTKGGQALSSRFKTVENGSELYYTLFHDRRLPYMKILNGTIPVKVVIDGYVKYVDCSDCTNNENGYECQNDFMYLLSVDPVLRKATCLTSDEIEDYGNGKDLYALHISKVEVLDEVMELGEFYKTIHYPKTSEYMTPHICEYKNVIKAYCGNQDDCLKSFELKRPPQSFMTVWVKS